MIDVSTGCKALGHGRKFCVENPGRGDSSIIYEISSHLNSHDSVMAEVNALMLGMTVGFVHGTWASRGLPMGQTFFPNDVYLEGS